MKCVSEKGENIDALVLAKNVANVFWRYKAAESWRVQKPSCETVLRTTTQWLECASEDREVFKAHRQALQYSTEHKTATTLSGLCFRPKEDRNKVLECHSVAAEVCEQSYKKALHVIDSKLCLVGMWCRAFKLA